MTHFDPLKLSAYSISKF